MGKWTDNAKNTMLDSLTTFYVSIHSANPGENGDNELSGTNYNRVQASLSQASSGKRILETDVIMTIPGGSTVAYVGYWTDATGGTFLAYDSVAEETYIGDGQYEIKAIETIFSIEDE